MARGRGFGGFGSRGGSKVFKFRLFVIETV